MKVALTFLASFLFTQAVAAPRAADDNLTWDFARERRAQIEAVAYDLHFELTSGADNFHGDAQLHITLTPAAIKSKKAVSIDFLYQTLQSVAVKGKEIKNYVARKGSLELPFAAISPALNEKRQVTIQIRYVSEFSKEGNGFQRSVDPEDQGEYLYTDFEPYQAHQLFPCFDQPDLKAVYQLRVTAPKKWKVIGNDLIANEKEEGDRKITTFAPTKPLSPYLFFVGAGDFREWTDTFKGKSGGQDLKVPLTLYARRSLAKFVDADEIFSMTKKGLQFFSDYFGVAYPFSKYGQLFVPEFNWGGMENPGAVTLNERNIYRGPVAESRRIGRIDLVLHEMAHMWFGDLVTMEWWNDLWLNESFATYAASLAGDRAFGIDATWQNFYGTKTWGYWQDQLVTTHPIETKVKDVRTAKGNFDGITYAKGAASLKQLHYYVGEKGFQEGLKSYFSKYAFKNSIRENFVGEIAAKSGTQLDAWTSAWLQSAGPHRVVADWKCVEGKVSAFSILQKKNASGKFSPHRTKVAFFRVIEGEAPRKMLDEAVTYSAEKTAVPSLVGKDCPDFVFPNLDDQDYALFALDPVSLKQVEGVLVHSQDPLLRVMVWSILSQMVRDALLPPQQFMEMAMQVLQFEKEESVLNLVVGRHSLISPAYKTYLTPGQREQMAPAVEAVLWQRLVDSEKGSSLQITFFDSYVRMVQTTIGLQKLVDLIKNDSKSPTLKQLKGLELDQDKRWQILRVLAAEGVEGSLALVAQEAEKDKSSQGRESALTAKVAYPDVENKKKYWAILKSPETLPKEMPRSEVESASQWFHSRNRPEISQLFAADFFKTISTLDWARNDSWVEFFFQSLFPDAVCSPEILRQSEKSLTSAKKLTDLARRSWREANDELGRCVAVRKKWASVTK